MTSSVAVLPASRARLRSTIHPCWTIVWLWVLSIGQYGYRYILQVNDPRTTHDYGFTPPALSAIKYAIFISFGLYGLLHFRNQPAIGANYRLLCYISASALVVLTGIALIRLATYPGDLDETSLCALQLIPWMASVFLVPLVFGPRHNLRDTLMIFERVTYWIAFAFWLTTVALVVFGIRYPALSYPGVLVRFGGILDDPNGYACLCLLLLVIAAAVKSGAWRTRVLVYGLMVAGTLSFSGYAIGLVMSACWLWSRLAKPSAGGLGSKLAKGFLVIAILTCAIATVVLVYESYDTLLETIDSLSSAKATSTNTHISDLLPDEAMVDAGSPVAFLFGIGIYSEDVYWRVLADFGWLGFFSVVSAIVAWSGYALWKVKTWRYSAGSWIIGVLIGSNGIPYLTTFPLNLLFWSLLALLVWGHETQRGSRGIQQLGFERG